MQVTCMTWLTLILVITVSAHEEAYDLDGYWDLLFHSRVFSCIIKV